MCAWAADEQDPKRRDGCFLNEKNCENTRTILQTISASSKHIFPSKYFAMELWEKPLWGVTNDLTLAMLNSYFAEKRHLGAFWSKSYYTNEIFTLRSIWYVWYSLVFFAYFRWNSTSSNCPRNRFYQSNQVLTSASGLFIPLSFLLSY